MKTTKQILEEIIGWYGTVAIIAAFALVSFGFLEAKSLLYQILNGTGAIGIVYISLKRKAYQPAVLNIIWTVIAGVAIAKIFIER
ncbi:MAG: hypothetical protein AAB551_04340 [Patescibacteria group bacterium]